MITVYHLAITDSEFATRELNKVGWGGHPLFEMYADITSGTENQKEQATKAFLEGHYKAVALIEGDSLGEVDVFGLTNHINDSWTKNPTVKALGGPQQRSTSVGDLVQVEGGELFLVAGIGFISLGTEDDLIAGRAS